MEVFIGLVMVYVWVHSVVIISKNLKEITKVETSILIAGLTAFVVMILGVVSK